jgi:hypothetical protein
MTNYPYYIAVRYDAGLLKKIKFEVQNGRKFDTWSDCAGAIKHYYKKFPHLKDEQILILEYANQYVSKIMDICKGDKWISIESPIKLM